MQKLADIIGVSRNYLSDYLLYIEKAGMIAQVRDDTDSLYRLYGEVVPALMMFPL